jgi:hypothetical protein
MGAFPPAVVFVLTPSISFSAYIKYVIDDDGL